MPACRWLRSALVGFEVADQRIPAGGCQSARSPRNHSVPRNSSPGGNRCLGSRRTGRSGATGRSPSGHISVSDRQADKVGGVAARYRMGAASVPLVLMVVLLAVVATENRPSSAYSRSTLRPCRQAGRQSAGVPNTTVSLPPVRLCPARPITPGLGDADGHRGVGEVVNVSPLCSPAPNFRKSVRLKSVAE